MIKPNRMKLIYKKYLRLLELSFSDLFIILKAMCYLIIIKIIIDVKGVKFSKEIVEKLMPDLKNKESCYLFEELLEAKKINRLVFIASNGLFMKDNCLDKSFITQYLLSKKSIKTNLMIGAKKFEDDIYAHAWIEYCDISLESDLKETDYKPFPKIKSLES